MISKNIIALEEIEKVFKILFGEVISTKIFDYLNLKYNSCNNTKL